MTSGSLASDVASNRNDEKFGENGTPLFRDDTLQYDAESGRKKERRSAAKCNFFQLRTFVLVSGVLMCAQSALSIYTKSVLTSIERRFQISSSLAGLIVGSFNFGNMMFVVLVSKLSSNGHRPRIMATGSMVVALGGFFNVIPHLASPIYDPSHTPVSNDFFLFNNTNSTHNILSTETPFLADCVSSGLYVLLIIGEMLQGIGATVLIPLGSSYIDDFARTGNSPLYLGIMFLLQNLGPGVGYLVGSLSTMLYVDFNRVSEDEIRIQPTDASWVGAWWLGYIILGLAVILTAIPLFWFPRRMEEEPTIGKKTIRGTRSPLFARATQGVISEPDLCKADDSAPLNGMQKEHNEKQDICSKTKSSNLRKILEIMTDLYLTVRRLITDPVYILVVLGYSGLMFVVGALTAFMPKFLEVVFYQSKSQASLTFGLSMPIVICIGLFSGGLIVQRCKWSITGTMRFICGVATATIFLCIPTYLVTCDPEPSELCVNQTINGSRDLQCVDNRGDVCRSQCYLFVAVMSLAALLSCHIITPIYSVILRNVNPRDKCTAIGLKFLIIRIVAFIPSPMITGAAIDDTCLEWSESVECVGTSTCLKHDVEKFRLSYLHIILIAVIFTCLFHVTAYVVLRHKKEKKTTLKTVNEAKKITVL